MNCRAELRLEMRGPDGTAQDDDIGGKTLAIGQVNAANGAVVDVKRGDCLDGSYRNWKVMSIA